MRHSCILLQASTIATHSRVPVFPRKASQIHTPGPVCVATALLVSITHAWFFWVLEEPSPLVLSGRQIGRRGPGPDSMRRPFLCAQPPPHLETSSRLCSDDYLLASPNAQLPCSSRVIFWGDPLLPCLWSLEWHCHCSREVNTEAFCSPQSVSSYSQCSPAGSRS